MAAKYKLLYLASADEDILKIVAFHADRVSPASAGRIYHTMKEQISQLQDFPLIGQIHPDPELAVQGYRKLVLTETYVAIYKLIGDIVTVYRVVNGKTDYPKLLK